MTNNSSGSSGMDVLGPPVTFYHGVAEAIREAVVQVHFLMELNHLLQGFPFRLFREVVQGSMAESHPLS